MKDTQHLHTAVISISIAFGSAMVSLEKGLIQVHLFDVYCSDTKAICI